MKQDYPIKKYEVGYLLELPGGHWLIITCVDRDKETILGQVFGSKEEANKFRFGK